MSESVKYIEELKARARSEYSTEIAHDHREAGKRLADKMELIGWVETELAGGDKKDGRIQKLETTTPPTQEKGKP